MNQTFFEKLKRVKLSDFVHVFKFLLAIIPAFLMHRKRKHLWLLCDTKEEAGDNAWWLFRYLREEHPEEDVVFAIDFQSPDYKKVVEIGEAVNYGSLKHWVYYLCAEFNISSQKMGKPNAMLCYVLEVYGLLKNQRIFLQHGLTTNKLSYLYYPNAKLRLFITNTEREQRFVEENFGYPEGYVKKLGMCRLDQLHNIKVNKKQILVMPSWRSYIRNEMKGKPEDRIRNFKKTTYFRYWNAFLRSRELAEFLEEKELELIFFPHREMRAFIPAFSQLNSRTKIATVPEWNIQDLLKSASLLITDYSSVATDFGYMKKPLIYYQFDFEEFYSKHLELGYFDYQTDGFGPVCRKPGQVLRELKSYVENGFENRVCYLERHEKFFDLWDTENCKRTYEALCEIREGNEK